MNLYNMMSSLPNKIDIEKKVPEKLPDIIETEKYAPLVHKTINGIIDFLVYIERLRTELYGAGGTPQEEEKKPSPSYEVRCNKCGKLAKEPYFNCDCSTPKEESWIEEFWAKIKELGFYPSYFPKSRADKLEYYVSSILFQAVEAERAKFREIVEKKYYVIGRQGGSGDKEKDKENSLNVVRLENCNKILSEILTEIK